MESKQHFTTRRGFVGAMGFGALGLYATWAAIGASPLPFSGAAQEGDHHLHAGDEAHSDPAMHEAHAHSAMTPEEFERRHADFLARFRQPDGSVRPTLVVENAGGTSGMEVTAHMGHASSPAASNAAEMADMENMPGMVGMHHSADNASADGVSQPPVESLPPSHATPDPSMTHELGAIAHDNADEVRPVEVYFAASQFAFEPDNLHLEVGRRYRFYMMATDVAHGASIAFGPASRIVRLRPGTVTTLDLTFLSTGRRLVYCTVYCGPGHDAMHGSITVA